MALINFESLQLLLNAKSKSSVEILCHRLAMNNYVSIPIEVIQQTKQLIECDNESQVKCLIHSLTNLITTVLHNRNRESIETIFPHHFDLKLKSLLIKIIDDNEDDWRCKSDSTVSSMQRLIDFDYRIEPPNCELKFRLKSQTHDDNDAITVMVTHEQISHMIEGMGKIRDELFAAAMK